MQSYLFDKAKSWTVEKAKAWFEKHCEAVKSISALFCSSPPEISAVTEIKSLNNSPKCVNFNIPPILVVLMLLHDRDGILQLMQDFSFLEAGRPLNLLSLSIY